MTSDPNSTFESVFAAFGRKLDADAELKELFAQAVMLLLKTEQAEPLVQPAGPEPAALVEVSVQPVVSDAVPSPPTPTPATPEQLNELVQSFKPVQTSHNVTPAGHPGGPASLKTIQARLRIKQEAIAQAMERAAAKSRGEDVGAVGQWFFNVISQAKALPNCYLWMCQARHDNTRSEDWQQTATAFQVLGRALALTETVKQSDAGRSIFEQSLLILAEAQSALRKACMIFDFEDADQIDVYLHLLNWSATEQMYIERYMKADDLADPKQSRDLLVRIGNLASELAKINEERKTQANLFGKIRYELKMVAHNPPEPASHWIKIIDSIDRLVSSGLPPNHEGLRELLIPHLDGLPDNECSPDGFKKFMGAVDLYLATQPSSSLPDEHVQIAEVQKVSKFLAGNSIVIIGGQCRHESRSSLMRAFRLSDLNWIETRAHETVSQFESAIAREGVKLVLLAIRWSSHSYGEVKKFCDKYGKKLVRLPRGYGVNQVAAEICNQCSTEIG